MTERTRPRPTPRPQRDLERDFKVELARRLEAELDHALRADRHIVRVGPTIVTRLLWLQGDPPYDHEAPEPEFPLMLVTVG